MSYYIRYTSDSQDFNVLLLSMYMYVLKRLEFHLTGSEFNVCVCGGGGVTRELCNTCSSIQYICACVCVYICVYECMYYVCMYVCVRACVIWVRERGTPHMHGHKAFHLQLVSEPTHSHQGGISGNVLPFPPLCRCTRLRCPRLDCPPAC